MTGNELKTLRLRCGRSQEELAHEIGVAAKTVHVNERSREVSEVVKEKIERWRQK